jgi:hypothetical protein
MKEGYVEKLEKELGELETKVVALKDKGAAGILEDWKARRAELARKIDELKGSSHDRWDVLKMGVDSAWAELRAAVETAMRPGAVKAGEPRKDRDAA